MVVDFDTKYFFYGLFDGLNSWVTELNHFAGIGHDDMIMLLVEIRFFVMCLVLPKLVFSYQATIQ